MSKILRAKATRYLPPLTEICGKPTCVDLYCPYAHSIEELAPKTCDCKFPFTCHYLHKQESDQSFVKKIKTILGYIKHPTRFTSDMQYLAELNIAAGAAKRVKPIKKISKHVAMPTVKIKK
jgi:hypothetical protein